MKITEQQIADATLHATVWEDAALKLRENALRRTDASANALNPLADFAFIVAGSYRKVVNTGEVSE